LKKLDAAPDWYAQAKARRISQTSNHKKQDRQMRQVHLLIGVTDRNSVADLQIARWFVRIDFAGDRMTRTTRSTARVMENILCCGI